MRSLRKYSVAVDYTGYACVVVDVRAVSEEDAKAKALLKIETDGINPIDEIDSVEQGAVTIIK